MNIAVQFLSHFIVVSPWRWRKATETCSRNWETLSVCTMYVQRPVKKNEM